MTVELKNQLKCKYILSREEGLAFFEEAIPSLLGISAGEFLRRFDAGKYADLPDTPEFWDVMSAVLLIPFGR